MSQQNPVHESSSGSFVDDDSVERRRRRRQREQTQSTKERDYSMYPNPNPGLRSAVSNQSGSRHGSPASVDESTSTGTPRTIPTAFTEQPEQVTAWQNMLLASNPISQSKAERSTDRCSPKARGVVSQKDDGGDATLGMSASGHGRGLKKEASGSGIERDSVVNNPEDDSADEDSLDDLDCEGTRLFTSDSARSPVTNYYVGSVNAPSPPLPPGRYTNSMYINTSNGNGPNVGYSKPVEHPVPSPQSHSGASARAQNDTRSPSRRGVPTRYPEGEQKRVQWGHASERNEQENSTAMQDNGSFSSGMGGGRKLRQTSMMDAQDLREAGSQGSRNPGSGHAMHRHTDEYSRTSGAAPVSALLRATMSVGSNNGEFGEVRRRNHRYSGASDHPRRQWSPTTPQHQQQQQHYPSGERYGGAPAARRQTPSDDVMWRILNPNPNPVASHLGRSQERSVGENRPRERHRSYRSSLYPFTDHETVEEDGDYEEEAMDYSDFATRRSGQDSGTYSTSSERHDRRGRPQHEYYHGAPERRETTPSSFNTRETQPWESNPNTARRSTSPSTNNYDPHTSSVPEPQAPNVASVWSLLPTYSSTSFVRAYLGGLDDCTREASLHQEPALIVGGCATAMSVVIGYFLENHILETRDHIALFAVGTYIVFSSYYMIYYFLERYSTSFRKISQDKKFYTIGNLLKAGVLISITPFAVIHLTRILVFDSWDANTLRNLGCIYAIPDFVSMIVVKRMAWSTWIHHLCVVMFNYFSVMNDYEQENVCRLVVVYAAFSTFAYCVNLLLASRFLGVTPRVARVLSFVALVVYVLCCATNWTWQVYYLRRLLLNGHDHWTVYLYMMLICFVMWDDIVLNKWLLRNARNTAALASAASAATRTSAASRMATAGSGNGNGIGPRLS